MEINQFPSWPVNTNMLEGQPMYAHKSKGETCKHRRRQFSDTFQKKNTVSLLIFLLVAGSVALLGVFGFIFLVLLDLLKYLLKVY